VNLFSAVPFIGPDLSLLIRGDYVVSDATLNRFFSFHVIAIPLVLIGLVVAHLFALHDVGSNNPDGIDIKGADQPKDAAGHPVDGIPFHPYYTVHDMVGVSVFLMVFSAIIFFAPELGGYFLEYNNFIPADSLKTPLHIAPVWYFTPYYSMLRATTDFMVNVFCAIVALAAIFSVFKVRMSLVGKVAILVAAAVAIFLLKVFDAKFWGVVVMGGSVIILFFLPWLDRSPVRSLRYRPDWHTWVYGVFVVVFFVLGYLGIEPPSGPKTFLAQVGTIYYFGFFLLMPWWSRLGEFKPVPARINFAPH
jgi:ubiquinol-cytochrome c reductase cytochrome b subunit